MQRLPAAIALAGALLALSCGETIQPSLQITILTPVNQDVFAGADRVMLQVGNEPPTTTAITPGSTFELTVPKLMPRPGTTAVITLTALNPANQVVAIGQTPAIEIGIYQATIAIQMQRPGTLALGPFQLTQPLADQVMLPVLATGLDNQFSVPVIAGGRVSLPTGDGSNTQEASTNALYVWNPLGYGLDGRNTVTVRARHRASGVVTSVGELWIFGGISGITNPRLVNLLERLTVRRVDLVNLEILPTTPLAAVDPATMRQAAPMVQVGANGPVYAIGGLDADGALDSIVVINPAAADPSTQLALHPVHMATPRAGHTATVVAGPSGAEVLVFGGGEPGKPVAEVITPMATAPEPALRALGPDAGPNRTGHGAVVLSDGRVVIIGGIGDDGQARADAVYYNPADRSFAPAPMLLATARSNATAFLAENDLVIMGGRDQDGAPIGNAEVFDIRSPVMPAILPAQARVGTKATTLPDRTVLLMGGVERSPEGGDEAPSPDIEFYRPSR